MSEKEINSYRFLSGKEPSDEMLAVIMKEATEEAVTKKKMADNRMKELMQVRRRELQIKYSERIRRISEIG